MAARCTWSRSQAARQRLVLGQERCDAKENEISAIPRLLERLELRGALVTIDAMGCQHGIADTILGRGADDLLALTSNRKSLHAEVAMSFEQTTDLAAHETTDADHGRVEKRLHWVMDVVFHDDLMRLRDPKLTRQHGPDPSYSAEHIQEYHQQNQPEKPKKISS